MFNFELKIGLDVPLDSKVMENTDYRPNKLLSWNNLSATALTLSLLVVGILASQGIISPLATSGAMLGIGSLTLAVYLTKGDLKIRIKRVLFRTLLCVTIVTGGALGAAGVLSLTQLAAFAITTSSLLMTSSIVGHINSSDRWRKIEYIQMYNPLKLEFRKGTRILNTDRLIDHL